MAAPRDRQRSAPAAAVSAGKARCCGAGLQPESPLEKFRTGLLAFPCKAALGACSCRPWSPCGSAILTERPFSVRESPSRSSAVLIIWAVALSEERGARAQCHQRDFYKQ